jgi:hypothetical protein
VACLTKHFTATAASAQGVTGPGALLGFYAHETGGASPSTLNLRDGLDATGRLIYTTTVLAGAKESWTLNGASFGQGIFVERSGAGTTRLNLFLDAGGGPTMATSKYFATNTVDELAITGPGFLGNMFMRETAGAASATVTLRDGLDATGPIIFVAFNSLSTKQDYPLYGAKFTTGVFIDRSGTGSSEVFLSFLS